MYAKMDMREWPVGTEALRSMAYELRQYDPTVTLEVRRRVFGDPFEGAPTYQYALLRWASRSQAGTLLQLIWETTSKDEALGFLKLMVGNAKDEKEAARPNGVR